MKRRYFFHVLCAVMLFATQLVAVMHSTRHELAAPQTVHCEICAVAHAAPMPPAIAILPMLPRFTVVVAIAAPAGLPDPRPFARPNSRAPPSPHLA